MTKHEAILRAFQTSQWRGKLRITYSGRSELVDCDGSNQSTAKTARYVIKPSGVGPADQHYWKVTLAKEPKQKKQIGNNRRPAMEQSVEMLSGINTCVLKAFLYGITVSHFRDDKQTP
jgi:hypothetical protein